MSTIVLRSTKGSPLSNTEVDANFDNLNTDKLQLGGTYTAGTANGVAYLNGSKVLTTGSALKFDGTNFNVSNSGQETNISGKTILFYNTGAGDALIRSADDSSTVTSIAINKTDLKFYSSGSEQMRLNSTGLGIGTSSPSAKLHIDSGSTGLMGIWNSTNANGGYITGQSSGTAVWDFGTAKQTLNTGGATDVGINTRSGFLAFGTANTERMRLDLVGNLGLGVTPSAWGNGFLPYQVGGGAAFAGRSGVTSQAFMGANWFNDGGSKYIGTGEATLYQMNAGSHQWFNAPSGTAGNAITFTQAMTLDSSGNLGLGVTPSAWGATRKAIQVGTSTGEGAFASASTYGFFSTNAYLSTAGQDFRVNAGYAHQYAQWNDGSHRWFVTGTSTAGSQITFTQAMTLDASGNLIVGGTSATGKAEVVSSGSQSTLVLRNASSSNGSYSEILFAPYTGVTAAAASIRNIYATNDSSQLTFATTNSNATPQERMRIDSSGNLLVGTTSVGDVAMITTVAPASRRGISAKTVTSAYGVVEMWNADTTGNNVFVDFYTDAGQTVRGAITYNRAGGLTVYNTTSDYRAKDISGPVTGSGALIDSTPVYMGKMKGATQERPMFIAHEVPAYAHTGEKDAVDADGNPVYQQMDASALVPVMWAEIQSLRKRLAAAGI